MAFRITPSLGPDLDQVSTGFYFDLNTPAGVSPQLGSRVNGNDGNEYVLVKAGGTAIANNAEVTVNNTTFAAAAGAGGFFTPAAIPANSYFWARKGSTL